MNVTVRHAAPQKLLVISLPTMPPPPPHPRAAQPHPDPVPVHPQIVVPPPVVIVPTPPSPIATTAVAVPPVVVPVAAAPAGPPVPVAPPTPAVAEGGDLSSRMIFAKPPSYPLESRRRHEQGTVVLMLLLSADGQVSTISVAESSGSERLDQAALAAVRKWRWAPLVRNGQPVMVQGKVRIPFLLTH
jgi:protein TonB